MRTDPALTIEVRHASSCDLLDLHDQGWLDATIVRREGDRRPPVSLHRLFFETRAFGLQSDCFPDGGAASVCAILGGGADKTRKTVARRLAWASRCSRRRNGTGKIVARQPAPVAGSVQQAGPRVWRSIGYTE
jgi:hypothetical protein